MPSPAHHTTLPTDPCIALPDRRTSERLPCFDLPEVQYVLRPSQQGRALLRDLSAEGVGLVVGRPLEVGAVLLVQFPGPKLGATHTLLARVVHATPGRADCWLVGCRLTPPLGEPELARLRQLLTRP